MLCGLVPEVTLGADGARQEESHALTAPRSRSRQQPKQLDAGMFQAEISSFAPRLAAEGKAANTIRTYTWLDRGGPEGDLMELNGWTSPQMLRRYGASARSARARRTYDRIMTDT
jgi:hypothetical protein